MGHSPHRAWDQEALEETHVTKSTKALLFAS
jgi:hypothetical protein